MIRFALAEAMGREAEAADLAKETFRRFGPQRPLEGRIM
jgi:hypothetical protein